MDFTDQGITVWELVSFGATPYGAYENGEILDLLCSGYRMPAPEHCPPELAKV